MSATASTPSPSELGPPEYVAATFTRRGLSMSTKWLDASVVRITVAGDVDASNATQLAHYVFGHAANCRHLIVDLQDVGFFATAGFTTLRIIGWRCADAAVTWTVICSGPVSRVLEICDPRRTLPVAKS
jgi:anti-anti-sigma factor